MCRYIGTSYHAAHKPIIQGGHGALHAETSYDKSNSKKPTLDPKDPNNRRPITGLNVFSKVMEKEVVQQLQHHLDTHKLLDPFQSGFRPGHGTETALLKIWDEALEAADEGESCLPVL